MTDKILNDAETLEQAVGYAVGAASMCWEDVDKAGVFESTRAGDIVDELVLWLRERIGNAYIMQPQDDLLGELTSLLNRYSAENVSGTPDFILAEFLLDSIKIFNAAVVNRANWRGESTELPALISLKTQGE